MWKESLERKRNKKNKTKKEKELLKTEEDAYAQFMGRRDLWWDSLEKFEEPERTMVHHMIVKLTPEYEKKNRDAQAFLRGPIIANLLKYKSDVVEKTIDSWYADGCPKYRGTEEIFDRANHYHMQRSRGTDEPYVSPTPENIDV